MPRKLAEIARRLGMPAEELTRKSVLSYVAQEIRLAEWDIADIKERYSVASRAELEDGIKAKVIYSHPAWEDLIHWENLEDYLSRLRATAEELRVAA